MSNAPTLTSEQLRAAAAIKDQIENLEARLSALFSDAELPSLPPAVKSPGKRRGRKPGSKNKPKEETTAAPAIKKKAKRKMSPEGRARIVAAQKARWAKKKGN